jgi:hypothetical protein
MNIVLASLVIAAASAAALVWISPVAQRRLAAWLMARAYYVENLRAERKRWQDLAAQEHRRLQAEFGVAE